jgi:hypothetical protein
VKLAKTYPGYVAAIVALYKKIGDITFLNSNHGHYSDRESSNVEMCVLGMFLFDMWRCENSTFKAWALANKENPKSGFNYGIGTNATYLEEDDNGDIHILDAIGGDPGDIPGLIKMTKEQFVHLLDDWHEKVCKHKPKEVIIRHENGQFSIESKN